MSCESRVHGGNTTGGNASALGGAWTRLVKSDAASPSAAHRFRFLLMEVGHQAAGVCGNPDLAAALDGMLTQRPQPRLQTLVKDRDARLAGDRGHPFG